MATNGEIKGLDKLIKDLKNLGIKGEDAIAERTQSSAQEIEGIAKSTVTSDNGKLRQSIFADKVNKLNWKVIAGAKYAAYVEFGTGAKVYVDPEMQSVASQFQNLPKGNFKLFEQSLLLWMKRKNIDEKYLFPIMMKILKAGLRPQPFLYPAFVKGRLNYIKDLEEELKLLTKQI